MKTSQRERRRRRRRRACAAGRFAHIPARTRYIFCAERGGRGYFPREQGVMMQRVLRLG